LGTWQAPRMGWGTRGIANQNNHISYVTSSCMSMIRGEFPPGGIDYYDVVLTLILFYVKIGRKMQEKRNTRSARTQQSMSLPMSPFDSLRGVFYFMRGHGIVFACRFRREGCFQHLANRCWRAHPFQDGDAQEHHSGLAIVDALLVSSRTFNGQIHFTCRRPQRRYVKDGPRCEEG
jgi:hypothetical protein